MIPTTCPHGKDPRMCAYCDKKDTCDCRCDKNTDVIWGEITGELKDQTDLQAALDKHTADILTVDTLAHSNEQRLDAVEGTANEANQRSKDNLTRLDSVEGTANTTKTLVDVHTTRIDNLEGTANEANQRSKDNLTRLDSVEGTANTTKTLVDIHTTRIDNLEGVANEANQRSKDNTKRLDQVQDSIDISVTDTNNGDLEFADESGNVVMRLSNGHIKTKNFDSETAQSDANENIIIIY